MVVIYSHNLKKGANMTSKQKLRLTRLKLQRQRKAELFRKIDAAGGIVNFNRDMQAAAPKQDINKFFDVE